MFLPITKRFSFALLDCKANDFFRYEQNPQCMDAIVVTDESINDYGYRVLTAGIDTSSFIKNPIMLYNHDRYIQGKRAMPIGKWEGLIKQPDGRMLAVPVFDLKDEDGARAKQKFEDGFLNAASVWLDVIEWSEDPTLMLSGQTLPTVVKSVLREISITDLPGNQNSVRLSYKGKTITLSADSGNAIEELHQFFNSNKSDTSMKNVIVLLNSLKLSTPLAETASEAEVINAINKGLGSISELQAKLSGKDNEITQLKLAKEQAEQKIVDIEKENAVAKLSALVEQGVKDGKLTPAQKTVFLTLPFETAKGIIDGMAPVKSITSQLTVETTETVVDEEVKSRETYDKLHKSNKLASLKASNFDEYAKLYRAKYGKDPVK